jgi:hypothetical protein
MPLPVRPLRSSLRAHRSAVVRGAGMVALLLVLASCSGGSAGPSVASMPDPTTPPREATASSSALAASHDASPTPGAGSGSTGTTGTTGGGTAAGARPQERLDDTPQEHQALIQAWDDCLVAHGAQTSTSRQAGVMGATTIVEPIPDSAKAACTDKLPLLPPELDPAQNPHYRDDSVALVACLRGRGVMVHLTQDTSVYAGGLSWTYDDHAPPMPADEQQSERTCTLMAFGGSGQ